MAGFSATFLVAGWFMDRSYATFESAEFGLLFAVVLSAVHGWSEARGRKYCQRWDGQRRAVEFHAAKGASD
jgi:hypothetical protein